MRAMFKEIGILVKEDLSDGIDNEALNLMINSISNLDINLYIDKSSNNKNENFSVLEHKEYVCLLYTSPSPRDLLGSRMPSSA